MPRKHSTIPWLDQRENGVWYVNWYEPGGDVDGKRAPGRTRRLSLGTTEDGQAQARFAAFLIDGALKAKTAPSALTVDRALDHYLEEWVNTKDDLGRPRVVATERIDFAVAHLRAHFGPMTVAGIDDAARKEYCRRRRGGEIGRISQAPTWRRELNVLMAAINHCVARKHLSADAVPTIELPPHGDVRDRWLTRAELARLFDLSQPAGANRLTRIHRFVQTAYHTASRKAAVVRLTWFQIDRESRLIALQPRGAQQTAKRRPTVPIFDGLQATIERAWAERLPDSSWFLDHDGPIRAEWENLMEACGFGAWIKVRGAKPGSEYRFVYHGQPITPHTLRHTRAVHMAQDGIGLWPIAQLLGDSLETVTRNYLHFCPEHLRLAVDGPTAAPVPVQEQADG